MKKHVLAALGLSLCLLLSACGATAAPGDGEISGTGTHSGLFASTEDAGALAPDGDFVVESEAASPRPIREPPTPPRPRPAR